MDEIRDQSEVTSETGETRNVEQQSLDDATLEPGAHIEQSGDFQQSEMIQENLVNVVDNEIRAEAEAESTLPGRSATSDNPIPLPNPAAELGGESIPSDSEIKVNPVPIPGGTKPVIETSLPGTDSRSNNPIPLPDPAAELGGESIPSDSEISNIPLPIPGGTKPVIETSLPGSDSRSNNPIPLPDPAAELGGESIPSDSEISVIPLPIPGEKRSEVETPMPGTDSRSNDPIPLPDPAAELGGESIPSDSEISDLPLPIPGEKGFEVETPMPGMDSRSNDPIPLPDPAAELEGEPGQAVGIDDALGDASSEVSEPIREANFQEPLLQQDQELQDTSQEGLQDLGNLMPGDGKVEGGPGDEFGSKEPGSDISGMPGFEGDPGNLTNDPGGPELPPGGIPDGGEMESRGGASGRERYEYVRDLARMGDAGKEMKFEPGAQTPKGSSSPTPQIWDYDEFDSDTKNHENAQVDYLNEMQKQTAARKKVKAAKTPTAKPKTAKPKTPKPKPPKPKPPKPKTQESNPADDGGEYTGSTSPDQKYNPNLISLNTADDMGDAPPDGILPKYQEQVKKAIKESKHSGTRKAGAELVTDPPETDPKKGKDAAEKPG
ncbi:hypothetical protein ACFLTX_02830 [Chloroflexota bacterium]